MKRAILSTVMLIACGSVAVGEPRILKESADRPVEDRLPDFSLAGYRYGAAVPGRKAEVSVVDFGATPDDDTDDTGAFTKALAESEGKCIAIPAGKFLLSGRLQMPSRTVLQGAGAGKTVLSFTTSLEAIEPKATKTGGGTPTSAYAFGSGFIRFRGKGMTSGPVLKASAVSPIGAKTITIETTGLAVGDELRIDVSNTPDNALANYLYRGDVRPTDTDIARIRARQIARVEKIEGDVVTLSRALRFEVRPEWTKVQKYSPQLVESGVQGVTVEFPSVPYRGHFKEDGYNAFAIESAAHCWLRDVEIVNCDSGVFMSGDFNTIDGIVLRADRTPDKTNTVGHHAISVGGSDNLITNFDIHARFIHDLTVGGGAIGNVWSNGKGADLAMDHHKWAPVMNLFSNIDTGEGTRYFHSGGTSTRGRHTAYGATFWNIRGKKDAMMPDDDFAPPGVFFIGVQGLRADNAREGWYVEPAEKGGVIPANLHAAQRGR